MKKLLKLKWFSAAAAALIAATAIVVFALNFNNWFGSSGETAASQSLFWNIDKDEYAYKSPSGSSSRQADKDDNYYHILFASDGRQVTRRAKDKAVVDKIDDLDVMGLTFDSNGIITDVIPIEDFFGDYLYYDYYVTKAEDKTVTLNSSYRGIGMETEITLNSKIKIYDLSGNSGEPGIPVDKLVTDDRVVVLADKQGKTAYIFITERYQIGDVYYIVDRKKDSSINVSTRKADEDGRYSFQFAVNGELVTLRAKTSEFNNAIDCSAGRCVGLSFDDEGYISNVTTAVKTVSGKRWASWYTVRSVSDTSITVYNASLGVAATDKTSNISKKCKVFNVCKGTTDDHIGEYSTVKEGDIIQTLVNGKGEVIYIWILTRRYDGEVYWNFEVKYDKNNECTTRTPDAGGYYVYDMAVGGRQVTVKTSSKEIATQIDCNTGHCVGLQLDGNIVTRAYSYANVRGAGGGIGCSWYDIDWISGNKIHVTRNITGANKGDQKELTLAANCKTYVVRGNYVDHLGETTNIYVGDTIHCLKNEEGEVSYIFIVARKVNLLTKTAYCTHCNKTVTWYGWRANTTLSEGGHYYLVQDVNPSAVAVAGKSDNPCEMTLDLNGHKITAGSNIARALNVNIGSTLNIVDSVGGGAIKTIGTKDEIGRAILVRSGAALSLYSGTIDASDASAGSSKGGAIYTAENAKLNIYGGTVLGGSAHTGGAIYLSSNASLNMSEGTVSGGSAVNGGAVYTNKYSTVNISGGVISGGTATKADDGSGGNGGNIYLAGTLNMSGGIIKNGSATTKYRGNIIAASSSSVNMSGGTVTADINFARTDGYYGGFSTKSKSFNLSGAAEISGDSPVNLYIEPDENVDGALKVNNLSDNAQISITMKNTGMFAENAEEYKNCFVSDKGFEIKAEDGNLSITGLYFDEAIYRIDSGQKIQLNAHAEGAIYTGSNASAAAVDSSGLITGIAVGRTKVTAKYEGSTATCYVIVGHYHCLECSSYGCMNDTNVAFKAWEKDDSLPVSGNYYLTKDITLTAQYKVTANVKLCLNGHTVTMAKRIQYSGNYTFSIADCRDTGTITTTTRTESSAGGCIFYVDNGILNLYSGTLDASHLTLTGTSASQAGAAVSVIKSTFNMYGGKIIGGSAVNGGAVSVGGASSAAGIFNMYSGEITGGKAKYGGNVYVSSTKASGTDNVFNMYGGKITGGTAAADAGNLYVADKFIMTGGTVLNGVGKTANRGNMLFGTNAVVKISDGTITNNYDTAVPSGYNCGIEVKSKSFTLSGKTVISDGTYLFCNSSAAFNAEGLEEGSRITVSAVNNTAFAAGANAVIKEYFLPLNGDNYKIVLDNTDLVYKIK